MRYWIVIGLLSLPGVTLSAELTTTPVAAEGSSDRHFSIADNRAPILARTSLTFSSSGSFWERLRKQRAMPLFRLINSHERELFIGIDTDGTVGFRYSFGR